MMQDIRFYCGVSERKWNHHPVTPGPYTCVAPVYGKTLSSKRETPVELPKDTQVIVDSGAFSDGPGSRLTLPEALERQYRHAEKWRYADQVTHYASYDLLIDEKWEGGVRHKARWTEADAEAAVDTTVQSARFLDQHRNGKGAILSAQGVSPQQYLRCAERVVSYLRDGDFFGLGGWCIIGKYPKQMLPVFRETLRTVIPFLGREGVEWVHVWGVCYAPALGVLLKQCDEAGIRVSTDSSGPCRNPAFGRWGYASWVDTTYQRVPSQVRGLDRARHVALTSAWLADFRSREPLHYTCEQGGQQRTQLLLLEDVS